MPEPKPESATKPKVVTKVKNSKTEPEKVVKVKAKTKPKAVKKPTVAEKTAKEKVLEKAREKELKAKEREAKRMPMQNGVRRPKPDTLCGAVWQLADNLSAKLKQPVPVKQLVEAAPNSNLNMVKSQYARWRKFNGVTGRVTLAKAK